MLQRITIFPARAVCLPRRLGSWGTHVYPRGLPWPFWGLTLLQPWQKSQIYALNICFGCGTITATMSPKSRVWCLSPTGAGLEVGANLLPCSFLLSKQLSCLVCVNKASPSTMSTKMKCLPARARLGDFVLLFCKGHGTDHVSRAGCCNVCCCSSPSNAAELPAGFGRAALGSPWLCCSSGQGSIHPAWSLLGVLDLAVSSSLGSLAAQAAWKILGKRRGKDYQ